jgi:hypothetical protein
MNSSATFVATRPTISFSAIDDAGTVNSKEEEEL